MSGVRHATGRWGGSGHHSHAQPAVPGRGERPRDATSPPTLPSTWLAARRGETTAGGGQCQRRRRVDGEVGSRVRKPEASIAPTISWWRVFRVVCEITVNAEIRRGAVLL